MKIIASILCLIFIRSICFSEHLFVGIMEVENYKELELSATVFANVSRIPELNDLLKTKSAQLAALPVLSGFEKTKRIRIIYTIDPDEPLSDINPANIAIIPTMDGGKEIENILNKNYMNHSYWRSNINVYDKPISTNIFELVAVAKKNRFLITSRSKSALLWVSKNKKLLNAPPLQQEGTLKFLINPQRVAAVLNVKGNPVLLQLFKPVDILQELEICNFTLTLNSQNLNVTVEASPLEGTPLTTLAKNLKRPDATLLNAIPSNAFLESISKCEEPEIWSRFAVNLQNYLIPSLREINNKKLFTGERIQYLAPSENKKGLVFVQIETLKDAAAVKSAISKLGGVTRDDSPITLEKIEPAKNKEPKHLCFKINLKNKDEDILSSSIYTIASLFIQHSYLEMQITDNKLITVIGVKDCIKDALNNMKGSQKNISLLKELSVRNEAFDKDPVSGTKLEITKLLRFTASIIPNITQQQLNILPEGGYGSTFGLIKENDKTIMGSFQISADELSALKNVGADGQQLMQKLLMSILMKRIENMDMEKQKN
ncbi:MAG: hypothetical protein PF904_17590 [Kiritimatiellae bacterium]|jgi:hypothetical protein|nr:hypothetical protein [Kiritimatiellia bacterium]